MVGGKMLKKMEKELCFVMSKVGDIRKRCQAIL